MKNPPLHKVVTITEHCDKIFVEFEFHPKTLALVKKIGSGVYKDYPKKHWVFPNSKRNLILHTFRSNGYFIDLRHVFPNEADVVSMLSTCKKCKKQAFVGRDDLCARCR